MRPGSTVPSQWDLETFVGRFRYYQSVSTDPINMIQSTEQVARCKVALQAYDQGDRTNTITSLWQCQKVVYSCTDPETGEAIWPLFRRSAFIPTNLVIFWGMLYSPQTMPFIVGWQVLNQGYTCCVNLANRNRSNSLSNEKIMTCFAAATGVATGVSMTVKTVVNQLPTPKSVVGKGLHWGIVPLCAIIGAGSTNVYLSRKNEIDQGIGLRASREMKGEPLATSHVAGSKAVLLTIMSRALIPVPTMFMIPILTGGYDKWMSTSKLGVRSLRSLRLGFQLTSLTACLFLSLPLSLAPFPQVCAIEFSELEEEARKKIRQSCNEQSIPTPGTLYYNRGL